MAELALRLVRPVRYATIPESLEYDEATGYRLRPGLRLSRVTDFRAEVHTNSHGTPNFQEDFSAYRYRVFAIGDSYTEGLGGGPDESYPFWLDLLLNQSSNETYQYHYGVRNLGVGGFGLMQSVARLEQHAGKLRAGDVVLFLGCENDYSDDASFEAGHRHEQFVANNPRWGAVGPAVRFLDQLQIVRHVKRVIALRRKRNAKERKEATGPTDAEASVAELQWTKIRELANRCDRSGALLVVSWTAPNSSYVWLKNKCAEEGLAFADWLPRVEQAREALPGLQQVNSHSGGHYRCWIKRTIAEAFARQVLDSEEGRP